MCRKALCRPRKIVAGTPPMFGRFLLNNHRSHSLTNLTTLHRNPWPTLLYLLPSSSFAHYGINQLEKLPIYHNLPHSVSTPHSHIGFLFIVPNKCLHTSTSGGFQGLSNSLPASEKSEWQPRPIHCPLPLEELRKISVFTYCKISLVHRAPPGRDTDTTWYRQLELASRLAA